MISLETPATAAHTAFRFHTIHSNGGVVEWSIAPVLKTGVGKPTVGSNPTPSANAQHSIPEPNFPSAMR